MSRKNWDKVADNQFSSMPEDFQKDWEELRQKISHQK
jgi:hypothetical protein